MRYESLSSSSLRTSPSALPPSPPQLEEWGQKKKKKGGKKKSNTHLLLETERGGSEELGQGQDRGSEGPSGALQSREDFPCCNPTLRPYFPQPVKLKRTEKKQLPLP